MNHDDPDLLPDDALKGVTVGISVSDSSDLGRLGLDSRHAELVVGEIARAILIAGGTLAYGGRLRPSGFTQQIMNEVRRFGTARHSLNLYLAFVEHRHLSRDELDRIDRELGTWGSLITLDKYGDPTDWRSSTPSEEPLPDDERAASYSALRHHMASRINGRILVGGQLRGYRGIMPGLVEEAILAVQHRQPIYLAGGFGGAAAAVARRLSPSSFAWLPADLPEGEDDPDVRAALDSLEALVTRTGWTIAGDGLTPEQRALLEASHRPGEIASLCAVGLATKFTRHEGQG